MKKNKSLLLLSGLFLLSVTSCSGGSEPTKSSEASSDGATSQSEAHVHTYVAHEEVPATCAKTGTGAYYSCSGCDKIFDGSKNVIDAVPTLPKDPSNHAKAPSLVYAGEYKKSYVVGDTFSMGEAVYKIKCDDCEGTALNADQTKLVTYTYPTDKATAFTADDVGKSGLKVTAKYSNYTVAFDVTVAKRATTIDDIANMNERCGFPAFKTLDGVTSSEGEIVYTFSDAKDGTYVTADEFNAAHPEGMTVGGDAESKIYYVKASVAATGEYEAASKDFTITITHRTDLAWGESADKSSDIYGCPDKTPVTFNKTVDAANQDILINDNGESKYAIDLTGIGAYATVKSIKYGDYDLGTDVDDLVISDELKADKANHGEGNVVVTVHSEAISGAPETDHVISVPVTFVTKLITNENDFLNYVQSSTETPVVEGYYKQTADKLNLVDKHGFKSWSSYFLGVYDGNGKTIAYNSNKNGGGFFGVLGNEATTDGATIKNLVVSDGWHSSGMDAILFAKAISNTTFDNVTVNLAGGNGAKVENNNGWIASQRFQNNVIKGCTFNASNSDLGPVFGGHNKNYAGVTNTFVNSKLTVKSYQCLWHTGVSEAKFTNPVMEQEGLTITCTAEA